MKPTLFALLSAPRRPDLSAVAAAFSDESASVGTVIFISDGTWLTVGASDSVDQTLAAQLRVAVGQGVTGQVARNGLAVRVSKDAPRTVVHRRLIGIEKGGAVARLCLPARGIDGQILGVVAMHRPTEEPYEDADVATFQPYADHLGLQLQVQSLRDAVDAHHTEREQLIAAAVSAQESERRRIAFDLHDGVSTALASMSFHLNAAELDLAMTQRNLDAAGTGASGTLPQALSQIAVARSLADLAYGQTRAAITGLHSLVLDDLGLAAAIESLAKTAPKVQVRVETDSPDFFEEVPAHAAASLFRIAQETLSNAIKHAEATEITMSLRRVDATVVFTTADNGVGFDMRAATQKRSGQPGDDSGHFGLSSIAERCALVGATLAINSRPGSGTTIVVELPLTDG